MKRDWKMFRLEDRILFEAAAAADVAEAAEDANVEPGADNREGAADATHAPVGEHAGQGDWETERMIAGEMSTGEPVSVSAWNGNLDEADLYEEDTVEVVVDTDSSYSTGRELVVINSSVADREDILAALKPNQEALVLESGTEAMAQIIAYLDANAGTLYSAIHIVSHGNDGYFVLNGEVINTETFNAADWAAIGRHMTDDGDIMLYGCNLAAGDDGKALAGMIAEASGADVASSDNLTGVAGDWVLEYNVGEIETASLSVDGYRHNLTNYLVVNGNDSGEGSLRWAVGQSNASTTADEITFYGNFTVTLTSDQILISTAVTISGNGVDNTIIQVANPGVSGFRIFEIANTVTIENLTLRGGDVTGLDLPYGGAILVNNSRRLTLNAVTVTDCKAYYGGAILTQGNAYLTATDCTFENNRAVNSGGSYGSGGAIYVNASYSLILDNCLFANNSAFRNGGALYITGTRMYDVTNSTFYRNTGTGNILYNSYGGAFYMMGGGTLNLIDCTLTENSARTGGGGVYAIDSGTTVNIIGSILVGNKTGSSSGTLNDATASGAVINAAATLYGSGLSAGNGNIQTNAAAIFEGGTATLDDHGGRVRTIAVTDIANLGAGYMTGKIDAVLAANAVYVYTDDYGVTWKSASGTEYKASAAQVSQYLDADGRGYFRTGSFTAGAYQIDGKVAYSDRDGERIYYSTLETAVAASAGGSVLHLAGTRFVISENLLSGRNLTLQGIEGATELTGTGSRVINLAAGSNLTLSGLSVAGGTVSVNGGAILVQSGAKLALTHVTVYGGFALHGGGVANNGTLIVDQSTFYGNSAIDSGGAIYNTGILTINRGTFEANAALNGGAIYSAGTMSIANTSFNFNQAMNNGAAVVATGKLTLTNSTFNANHAANHGGGLVVGGSAVLEGVTFYKNTANTTNGQGGGIQIDADGTLTLVNSTFTLNSAAEGGGVHVVNGGRLYALNNLLVGNDGSDLKAETGSTTVLKYNVYGGMDVAAGFDATNMASTAAAVFGTASPVLRDSSGYVYTVTVVNMNTLSGLTGRQNLQIGKTAAGEYLYRLTSSNYFGYSGDWFKLTDGSAVGNTVGSYLLEDGRGFFRLLDNTYSAGAYQYEGAFGWYNSSANAANSEVTLCDYYINDWGNLRSVWTNGDGVLRLANTRILGDLWDQIYIYGDIHIIGQENTSIEVQNPGVSDRRLFYIGNYYNGTVYAPPTVILENLVLRAGDISLGNTYSSGAGAAIYLFTAGSKNYLPTEGTNLTLNNVTVTDGKARHGGAIFTDIFAYQKTDKSGNITAETYIPSILNLNDCHFVNNSALVSGGAIGMNVPMVDDALYDPVLSITGGSFVNNSATYSGGAISIMGVRDASNSLRVRIDGVEFTGNRAFGAGGAITFDATGMTLSSNGLTNLYIANSTFTANYAMQEGGAIFVGAYEGQSAGAAVEIVNSAFNSNVARNGGAVYVDQLGESDIYDPGNYLSFNIRLLPWFLVEQDVDLRMVSDTLSTAGGRLDAEATSGLQVAVTGSKFNYNRAEFDGGAIGGNADAASGGLTLHVDSATFAWNTAGANGGALHAGAYLADVLNSTFAWNTALGAGGALYGVNGATMNLVNSTVAYNTGKSGGGATVTDGAALLAINSILLGNSGGDLSLTDGGSARTAYSIYANVSGSETRFGDTNLVTANAAEVFGDTPALTRSGTLAIQGAGSALRAGTLVALVDGAYVFRHGSGWTGMDGVAVGEVSAAQHITASQNGITRNDMQQGYNVGAHALVLITVDVNTVKVYDGTVNIGSGGYTTSIHSTDADWNLTDADFNLTSVYYTSKNAGSGIGLVVNGELIGDYDPDDYYVIFTGQGDIAQAELVITAESDSVIYNGQYYTVDEYAAILGLQAGDVLAGLNVSGSGKNAGQYKVTASGAKIMNGTEDVTGNYKITYVDGQLDIAQAELTIVAGSDRVIYNGRTSTCQEYADLVGLQGNDTLAGLTVNGSGKNAGSYTVSASDARIMDGAEDVTGNYKINYVDGVLEIGRAELTIVAGSDRVIYNGRTYTYQEYADIVGLQADDVLAGLTVNGSGKNAGSYTVSASGALIMNGGEDVTGNYQISYVDGVLEIAQAELTIVAGSAYVVYNGAHYSITDYAEIVGLQADDVLAAFDIDGTGRNAGSYEVNIGNALIMSGGENVTGNYNITYVAGTLEIARATVTVNVHCEKTYDGTVEVRIGDMIYYLDGAFDGDDVHFDLDAFLAEYTHGNCQNGESLAVLSAALRGEHADNYELYIVGTGKINPRELVIGARDHEKYAGEDDPELLWDLLEGELLDGHILAGNLTRVPGEDGGYYVITNESLSVNDPNYIIIVREGLFTILVNEGVIELASDTNEWKQPYAYNDNYNTWIPQWETRQQLRARLGDTLPDHYSYTSRFEIADSVFTELDNADHAVNFALEDDLNMDMGEGIFKLFGRGMELENSLNRIEMFKDDFDRALNEFTAPQKAM